MEERKKSSVIIFKLVPNQQTSQVGEIIMNSLDLIFLNIPKLITLWDRLPITYDLWFRNQGLIDIRKIFSTHHKPEGTEKRKLWDLVVNCEEKKQILLGILSH